MVASVVGCARTPSNGTDATGASLALAIPAGTAADDYALIEVELWDSTATNPTLGYPAGFTEIVNYASSTDGFQKQKAAIKKLTAADSGTYTVTGFASHFRQGHVTIMRGLDLTTVLDVAVNLAQNASGTALPANSLTTVNAGCLILRQVCNENSSTGLPDTGYTEQADSNYLKTNTKVAGAAGTETPAGGSFSASTLKLGAMFAFRAAAGGGSNLTLSPADNMGLTDSFGIDLSKGVADSEGLSDVAALDVGKSASDTEGLTDSAVFEVQKVTSDAEGLTDASALDLSKVASDNEGLTDSLTLALGRGITAADSEGLTDTFSAAVEKSAQDALGLTDSAQVSLSAAGQLSVSDDAGLADTVAISAGKTLADDLGLTDSFQVEVFRLLSVSASDTEALTDTATLARIAALEFQYSAGLTDQAAVAVQWARSDGAGLSDIAEVALAASWVYADATGLTDSFSIELGPAVEDRDLRLAGYLLPNRFGGTIAPGRFSGSLQPGRLKGEVEW